ncbi:MAG: hypothetical protein D6753_17225 [Planctomycetota bacterium]|nr:MAG: hypothetical protein D6753_17225 [Planctomycetota bacterium]
MSWWRIWLCAAVMATCGCWRAPLVEDFGAVRGRPAINSLNGLRFHQEMWEAAGAKVLLPSKLSPRLETFDALVLVGRDYGPPGRDARRWLEQWLERRNGRTVVYFGRDFNAAIYYRQRTLDQVPAQLQGRAEEEIARRQIEEFNLRVSQLPENTFADWCYFDVNRIEHRYTRFSGPWAEDLADRTGYWPVRTALLPPADQWRDKTPSWITANSSPGPAGPSLPPSGGESTRRSVWSYGEYQTDEEWQEAFQNIPEHEILLQADDGTPLVYRIPVGPTEGSQILVVANGAPLLAGSLVDPLHRRVGERLVEACLPARRVGLLAYDRFGLLISNVPEQNQRGIGLEMLTVWPLSAVTMPAALLGILLCMALLPIFGRPRRLPRRTTSDFGLHVEALGQLLHRTRDRMFALRAIADYFTTVRGDPPPVWLVRELRTETPPQGSRPVDGSAEPAASPADSAASGSAGSKSAPESQIASIGQGATHGNAP